MSENIFADDWRDCLQAHYQHVIRTGDRVTEPTLRVVMHQAGFTDAQLAELRVRATMHVDDIGADFVPDLDVLSAGSAPTVDEPAAFPGVNLLPAEAAVVEVTAAELPSDETLPEIDDQELLAPFSEEEERLAEEPPLEQPESKPGPDVPQQLSLF